MAAEMRPNLAPLGLERIRQPDFRPASQSPSSSSLQSPYRFFAQRNIPGMPFVILPTSATAFSSTWDSPSASKTMEGGQGARVAERARSRQSARDPGTVRPRQLAAIGAPLLKQLGDARAVAFDAVQIESTQLFGRKGLVQESLDRLDCLPRRLEHLSGRRPPMVARALVGPRFDQDFHGLFLTEKCGDEERSGAVFVPLFDIGAAFKQGFDSVRSIIQPNDSIAPDYQ